MDLSSAGGTESMSNAPYIMRGARWGYRMGNGELIDSMLAEGLTCAIKGCHMGNTAEEIVKRFDVSRDDQDAFAAESQRAPGPRSKPARSATRSSPSRFRSRRAPRCGWTRTSIRAPERRPRSWPALKPAFAKDGSVTAGNASGINDGAAALVVATEEKAAALGRKPLARDPLVLHDRRRSDDHGHGAGRSARSAPRSARSCRSTTSICSS